MTDSSFYDALHSICQPIRVGDYPRSLTAMHRLLGALDDPQKRFPSVVVTGSVGKGTTCHYIARLMQAADLKVGLYTSPHLHSFRERFVINGQVISPEEFIEGAAVVRAAADEAVYSTFEQATALAFWWFARHTVDIAVLEVGIGGRWDAVNVVSNVLAVFSPIESEHMAMLGGSLQSIAWRKAGIIRQDGHAVTGRQGHDVMAILQHEAAHKRARLHVADAGPDAQPQERAAYLAMRAYQNLLERKIITRRMFQLKPDMVRLAGRLEQMQVAGKTVLIDGGHTRLSAHALRDMIDALAKPTEQVYLVVGMLQDKAAVEYVMTFDSPFMRVVLTQAPGHRAINPEVLAAEVRLERASIDIVPDLQTALLQVYDVAEGLFVVGGSLRMAAAARETYGLLTDDEAAEAQATRRIFEGDDYLAKLSG